MLDLEIHGKQKKSVIGLNIYCTKTVLDTDIWMFFFFFYLTLFVRFNMVSLYFPGIVDFLPRVLQHLLVTVAKTPVFQFFQMPPASLKLTYQTLMFSTSDESGPYSHSSLS